MENGNPLPTYLLPTYQMLQCAFPDGIRAEAYWPLLAVLHEHMSFRNIGVLLSFMTGKHYIEVYNDASGFCDDDAESLADSMEEIRNVLLPCEYEQWRDALR